MISRKYKDECLNIICYPPEDEKPIKYRGKYDPLRHFVKGNGRWEIRNHHQNPCMGCALPWCEFKKHKKVIEKIVNDMKANKEEPTNR